MIKSKGRFVKRPPYRISHLILPKEIKSPFYFFAHLQWTLDFVYMYWKIFWSFFLWDEFSAWSASKANFYLNFVSERNSSILFPVLFPSILKVINFQWQLIITEDKSESIWLFVWYKLGKVFFNWKVFLLYAFQLILHCIYYPGFIL